MYENCNTGIGLIKLIEEGFYKKVKYQHVINSRKVNDVSSYNIFLISKTQWR